MSVKDIIKREILEALEKAGKPVGINVLAKKIGHGFEGAFLSLKHQGAVVESRDRARLSVAYEASLRKRHAGQPSPYSDAIGAQRLI